MRSLTCRLFFVWLVVGLCHCNVIQVAFLAPKENTDGYNASSSIGAIVYALETIHNETGLLDGHLIK